jgi:hypothetical protein
MMKKLILLATLLAGLASAGEIQLTGGEYCGRERQCYQFAPGHTATLSANLPYSYFYLWLDEVEYYAPTGNLPLGITNVEMQSIEFPSPYSFDWIYTGKLITVNITFAKYCGTKSCWYYLTGGSIVD